jgi:heptosyltransferase-2
LENPTTGFVLMINILLIQTAFLGDVILTTPLATALKNKYPEAAIDVLAIPVGGQVWQNNPRIRDIILFDKRKKHRGALALRSLGKQLRKKAYQLVVSPHRSLRSGLLACYTGAVERITFDKSTMSWLFFNRRVKYRQIHEIDRNLSLIDVTEKIYPEIYPSEEEKNRTLALLQRTANPNIIAIAPGSVWETKKWPIDYFAKVVKELCRMNIAVVLIGGKADAALCQHLADGNHDVLNLAGQLNVRESYQVIRQSRVLLTNDSAPLHMGSAAGTPVIAVFGPTIAEFGFGPYNTSNSKIIDIGELHCRPCGIHGANKCPTGTFECMLNVKPHIILEAITEKLNDTN